MKITLGKVLTGPAGYALVIVVGGVAVWLLWREIKKVGTGAADNAKNTLTGHQNFLGDPIVDDSPYSGFGVLGSLGSTFDEMSGGKLHEFGDWIGGAIISAGNSDPLTPIPSRNNGSGSSY